MSSRHSPFMSSKRVRSGRLVQATPPRPIDSAAASTSAWIFAAPERTRCESFYVCRGLGEDQKRYGWIEFSDGAGGYLRKQTGHDGFPTVCAADTNAVYQARFPSISDAAVSNSREGVNKTVIVKGDEFLVMRTRVSLDADGQVKSANYSKIIGPFSLGLNFTFGKWYSTERQMTLIWSWMSVEIWSRNTNALV